MEIDVKRDEVDASELTRPTFSTARHIKIEEDEEDVVIKQEPGTAMNVSNNQLVAGSVELENSVSFSQSRTKGKFKSRKRGAGAVESDALPPKKSRRIEALRTNSRRRSKPPAHSMEQLLAPGSRETLNQQEEAAIGGQVMHHASQVVTKEKLQRKDEDLLRNAINQFQAKLEAGERYKIPECETPLTIWQLVSADQMIRREKARKPPKGGALCSQMGLGKTLTMLAVIAHDRKSLKSRKTRNTLVLVPNSSIARNWIQEATSRCDVNVLGKIVRFKGATPEGGGGTPKSELQSASVIIATYDEIIQGGPSYTDLRNLNGLKASYEGTNSSGGHASSPLQRSTGKTSTSTSENPDLQTAINEVYSKATNPLFHFIFHRVVLDEGHIIKNHRSKKAQAALALRKSLGWVITGTPITNCTEELFPYLRFIGDPASEDRPGFLTHYLHNEESEIVKHMGRTISKWFIRWDASDEFLGRKILELPPVHSTVQWIELSVGERIILESLKEVFRAVQNECQNERIRRNLRKKHEKDDAEYRKQCDALKISYEAEKGDRGKDLNSVVRFVSKLRDVSIHPYLLEPIFEEIYTEHEAEALLKSLRAYEASNPQPLHRQIGPWDSRVEVLSKQSTPKIDTRTSPTVAFNPLGSSKIGDELHITRQLECIVAAKIFSKLKCAGAGKKKCTDPTGSFWKGQCGHIMCSGCKSDLISLLRNQSKRDRNGCRACGKSGKSPVEPLALMWHLDYPPTKRDAEAEHDEHHKDARDSESSSDEDESSDEEQQSTNKEVEKVAKGCTGRKVLKAKHRRPGDDLMGYQPKPDNPSRLLALTDEVPCLPLVGSSKLAAVKETVLRWQAEAPNDKILIFLEHKLFAQCICRLLEAERIKFLSYFGDASCKSRDRTLNRFKHDSEIPVMIISMECGGQALNITEANRVIIAELWWNEAKEEQACGRISRIGQSKPMFYTRIVVRDSFEHDIRRESRRKTEKIKKILLLEEVAGVQASFHRVVRLFGEPQLDDLGRIVNFMAREDAERADGSEDDASG